MYQDERVSSLWHQAKLKEFNHYDAAIRRSCARYRFIRRQRVASKYPVAPHGETLAL